MIDIPAARSNVEKMSGFNGLPDTNGSPIGNQVATNSYVMTPHEYLYGFQSPYTFNGKPAIASDPADLFFDTYNLTGYLHQWRPGDPVPVNHEGYSQAAGATHKCGCKGGAKCKCNANGKPCPCKQGKPCPCKSNASGTSTYEDSLAAADAGVAQIVASGYQAQSAAEIATQSSTTIYWVIGGVVLLAAGVGAYFIIKNHKKS